MEGLNTAIDRFDYEQLNNEIKRTMKRSARDIVQIGYMLRRMMDEKLWQSEYSCLDDYLSSELGIDYTMATRMVKINKKYSIGGNSMYISEAYANYSQGLLIEMLNMPKELEEKVNPDMTVKQVRQIKKDAKKKKEQVPVPEQNETVIDAEYREVDPEPVEEKVATSQELSPYGLSKTVYPEGSMLSTEGCGHKHDCFSCAKECNIRQKNRYCVEAPIGHPFECTTMNVLENIRQDGIDNCQFINDDLAFHRAGDGQPSPCCKNCDVSDCGYRCRRSSGKVQEKTECSTEIDTKNDDLKRLRKLLDNKNKELKEWMDVAKVEDVPEDVLYEKKTVVGALASMLCELEDMQETKEPDEDIEPEKIGQPELPALKNNDQRKEWLADYKAWGLWYRDDNIDVNYYKYDFPDGSRLVVAEYPKRHSYWTEKLEDEVFYHLLEKNKKSYRKTYDELYRHRENPETYLVEFLKNLQKRK